MIETVCVCNKVRRAARVVTRVYDEALARSGLKVTQFSLLRMLMRLEGQPITALAEAVGLDRTTLARNLQALARDGLVAFVPGRDQRERRVRVTDKGRRLAEGATPHWEAVQERVRAALGDADHAQLFDLLGRLERMDPA